MTSATRASRNRFSRTVARTLGCGSSSSRAIAVTRSGFGLALNAMTPSRRTFASSFRIACSASGTTRLGSFAFKLTSAAAATLGSASCASFVNATFAASERCWSSSATAHSRSRIEADAALVNRCAFFSNPDFFNAPADRDASNRAATGRNGSCAIASSESTLASSPTSLTQRIARIRSRSRVPEVVSRFCQTLRAGSKFHFASAGSTS